MDGDADGSLAMNEAASKFREEHDKLRLELITPERTKSVCEVCGVFINSTDSEQRLQVCNHLLVADSAASLRCSVLCLCCACCRENMMRTHLWVRLWLVL
jgi:hypothetical protein